MAIQPGVKFQGEKQDLEEMLGNLLDNACKWGKSRVYLTATVEMLQASSQRKQLKIAVKDAGPGFRPNSAPKSVSAACAWMKRSRVLASDSRSSAILLRPIADG